MLGEYNWNVPLIPGTIVCAAYNEFEGERKVGIFCVLYDEQLDNNILQKKNVFAIKLSTQTTLAGNYSVEVPINRNEFLDKQCVACCSKIHTLHKIYNIYKVLGTLDAITMKNIYKTYNRFVTEVERQILDGV